MFFWWTRGWSNCEISACEHPVILICALAEILVFRQSPRIPTLLVDLPMDILFVK